MRALSELFYHLYAKTIVLFTYMLIELILIIRYLKSNHTPDPISTTQYLNFIEEKNPTTCYTKRLKTEHVDCRVCLSEFEEGEKVRNLNCEHTFHKDCLDKWFLQEEQYCATCPLCRKKVLPEDVVANYHLLQNQVEVDYDDGSDDQFLFLLSALRGGSTLHRYL
ncbi:Zinc finger, RING-type [Sesbania bispinosa]|nr:Zinc finger, RING-type [Sesbania bispinosa]